MNGNGFRPPVTLRGRYIELVPLSHEHAPGLAHAGRDPDVWKYLRVGPGHPPDLDEMHRFIDQLLGFQSEGNVLAEVITLLPERVALGIIRFLDIDRPNHAVELGTWIDSAYWRSPVNTDAKLAMLAYAFEVEKVHRVQFKTDGLNTRSQRALERLGAIREGELRDAHLMPSGRFRTSVYYSILADEWPSMKRSLEQKLSVPWEGRSPARGP